MDFNDIDRAQPRRWYFAFTDDNSTFWRHLLRPGFRHVFAFTELAPELCFAIDPLRSCVEHELHNHPLHKLVSGCKERGYTVLMLRVTPDPAVVVRRGWLITCASYLAYTVGLPFFGFTPYHLHIALLKHGAEGV